MITVIMNREIYIKGRKPQKKYSISLKEIFSIYSDRIIRMTEVMDLLDKEGIRVKVDRKTVQGILNYRKKAAKRKSREKFFIFAGPFSMNKVLDSHFLYNLDYQDVVVKTEIEKAEEKFNITHTESERDKVALEIFKFISIILCTDFYSDGHPLYISITNLELDYIILKCLSFFDLGVIVSNQELIKTGNVANELSSKIQEELLLEYTHNLKEILNWSIFSGVIWWNDIEIQKKYTEKPIETLHSLKSDLLELSARGLSINDYYKFQEEVLNANKTVKIIYFLDDNGELAWDLLFIQKMIDTNNNVNVACIVHDQPVSTTANYSTLSYLLERSQNYFLKKLNNESRFTILREKNDLAAFDPRFMSSRLAQELCGSDIVISKGASNFEKLQYVPIPIYYLFTVYSKVSTILTGFEKFSGIFARVGPRLSCFENIQSSNREMTVGMNLKIFHKKYKDVLKKVE